MSELQTILVVDDDPAIRRIICRVLSSEGFSTEEACGGLEAVHKAESQPYSLIILDLMMPKIDGLQACMRIREFSNVPIIMLTARSEDTDKIIGFECGADDYLAKPFLPRELLFRVQAILRRTSPAAGHTVRLAAAEVDLENAVALRDGQASPLTAKELQLFRKLYENAGRIVTTGALCETVCGPVWQGYESTLATHIRHLREKIEANPSKPVSIVTVKGLGYRLDLPGSKGAAR